MRRILIFAVLLLCGCKGIRGPFDPVSPMRVDDPNLPISEQERLGRDRYASPEETDPLRLAPPTSVANPNISPYPY